jgi:hypothetical protein
MRPFFRDTDAVPGNTPVRDRSSQLTDWLFLERYVSIVWTRRRVRDERIKVKFALGLLVSSAKRGDQSAVPTTSLRHGVCRIPFKESNSNFQLPRFKWCAAALNYASKLQRMCEWLLSIAFQLVVQNNGLRDFFHGLAHLLALPLHGPIRFILADFQLALQDTLGALHKLSSFQLP